MSRLPAAILAIAFCMLLAVCTGRTSTSRTLEHAQTIMRSHTDEASATLDSLSRAGAIKSSYDHAKYALLRLEERYFRDVTPNHIDDSLTEIAESYFRPLFSRGSRDYMLTLYLKGYNLVMRGKTAEGIAPLLEAEELADYYNEYLWLAQSQQYIAHAYDEIWDANNSLNYTLKAQKAFEQFNDSTLIRQGWDIVASSYLNSGSPDMAKPYIDMLLKCGEEKNDSDLLRRGYDALGFWAARTKNHEMVIEAFDKAVEIDSNALTANAFFRYIMSMDNLGVDYTPEKLTSRKGWVQFAGAPLPSTYWAKRGDYRNAYLSAERERSEVDSVLSASSQSHLGSTVTGFWLEKRRWDAERMLFMKIGLGLVIAAMVALAVFAAVKISRAIKARRRSELTIEELRREIDQRNDTLYALNAQLSDLTSQLGNMQTLETELTRLREDFRITAEERATFEERIRELDKAQAKYRDKIISLMGDRYKELARLFDAIRIGSNNPRLDKADMAAQLKTILSALQGKRNIQLLAKYIDLHTEGLFSRFKADFPDLSDDEYTLVVYAALGVPSSVAATLLDVSEGTYRTRRSRSRSRIASSDSPMTDAYLSLFGSAAGPGPTAPADRPGLTEPEIL